MVDWGLFSLVKVMYVRLVLIGEEGSMNIILLSRSGFCYIYEEMLLFYIGIIKFFYYDYFVIFNLYCIYDFLIMVVRC